MVLVDLYPENCKRVNTKRNALQVRSCASMSITGGGMQRISGHSKLQLENAIDAPELDSSVVLSEWSRAYRSAIRLRAS